MIGLLDFMLILGSVFMGLLIARSDRPRWKL